MSQCYTNCDAAGVANCTSFTYKNVQPGSGTCYYHINGNPGANPTLAAAIKTVSPLPPTTTTTTTTTPAGGFPTTITTTTTTVRR
jgi:hypothetical protein